MLQPSRLVFVVLQTQLKISRDSYNNIWLLYVMYHIDTDTFATAW